MTKILNKTRMFARLTGKFAIALSVVELCVIALAPSALAYVGPGAGLGILGTLIALIIIALASVFGLILLVFRTITGRRKKDRAGRTERPL